MKSKREIDGLTVFISSRESTCDACGAALGRHAWITLQGDKGVLCLTCAVAVLAHIRHTETIYDQLLSTGADRAEARARVWEDVASIAHHWE